MPRVLNRRTDGCPNGAVYVGRPSKFGNPFVIGRDGDRARVVERYRAYLRGSPELIASLPELRGHDLVCHCAPLACHADVLLELAAQTGSLMFPDFDFDEEYEAKKDERDVP